MTDLANTTIAVTGAGGFLGHSLCRKLFERGARVRMLVRYRSESPGEHQFDLTNSILDPDGLAPPVRAVVHCAWDAKSRDAADYKRTNIDGSLFLIDRCRQAQVEQFVFISSLLAHEGSASLYGQSKLEVENRLFSLSDSSTFSTVIAPGLILGSGGNFSRARAMVRRFPIIPAFYGFGRRRLQSIFVDELCDAIVKSITDRITGRLLIADDKGVKLTDFYRGVAALDNKSPLVLPALGDPALLVTSILEACGLKPTVSTGALKDLRHLQHFDIAPSNNRLDAPPRGTFWQSLEKLAMQENKPKPQKKSEN